MFCFVIVLIVLLIGKITLIEYDNQFSIYIRFFVFRPFIFMSNRKKFNFPWIMVLLQNLNFYDFLTCFHMTAPYKWILGFQLIFSLIIVIKEHLLCCSVLHNVTRYVICLVFRRVYLYFSRNLIIGREMRITRKIYLQQRTQ